MGHRDQERLPPLLAAGDEHRPPISRDRAVERLHRPSGGSGSCLRPCRSVEKKIPRSAVVENFGPNFGPLTPKHQGKPRNPRDQRTRRTLVPSPNKRLLASVPKFRLRRSFLRSQVFDCTTVATVRLRRGGGLEDLHLLPTAVCSRGPFGGRAIHARAQVCPLSWTQRAMSVACRRRPVSPKRSMKAVGPWRPARK
jgi:hypothetical protein